MRRMTAAPGRLDGSQWRVDARTHCCAIGQNSRSALQPRFAADEVGLTGQTQHQIGMARANHASQLLGRTLAADEGEIAPAAQAGQQRIHHLAIAAPIGHRHVRRPLVITRSRSRLPSGLMNCRVPRTRAACRRRRGQHADHGDRERVSPALVGDDHAGRAGADV